MRPLHHIGFHCLINLSYFITFYHTGLRWCFFPIILLLLLAHRKNIAHWITLTYKNSFNNNNKNTARSHSFIYNNWHTATAIPFIYSFSGNSAASAPISTFMCLWVIYTFPGLVYIFPPAEKADPSWEYIICSQTHKCGNWDWGPDISFLGVFVSNFRHFFFALRVGLCLNHDSALVRSANKNTLRGHLKIRTSKIPELFSGGF